MFVAGTLAVLLGIVSFPAAALASPGHAKITPSDRALEYVAVYAAPSPQSAVVAQLEVGESADLIDDIPYWYKIALSDETQGFVSKGWTVLVASNDPEVPDYPSSTDTPGQIPMATRVTVHSVGRVVDLSRKPPPVGTYRIQLIDVGTGLSVLVQGADFNLLFDGGSRDEKKKISKSGNGNRLLAYLFAAIGPSGPPECVPDGDGWEPKGSPEKAIQHVFLSHPHEDHNSLLPDVFHCYKIENVWESGINSPTGSQAHFVQAAANEPGVKYHTAATAPSGNSVKIGDELVKFPEGLERTTFQRGDQVNLGQGAKLLIVHADPEKHGTDYNLNSIVLRLDLGRRSLLLTGDTESGDRLAPSAVPARAEQEMLESDASSLDVDILQVAHHGSKTSSRRAFLDAVSPNWALVSSGPYKYSGVTLPDAEVLAELKKVGATVLSTDVNDGRCPVEDRIGLDTDQAPGGCDNYILEITP